MFLLTWLKYIENTFSLNTHTTYLSSWIPTTGQPQVCIAHNTVWLLDSLESTPGSVGWKNMLISMVFYSY